VATSRTPLTDSSHGYDGPESESHCKPPLICDRLHTTQTPEHHSPTPAMVRRRPGELQTQLQSSIVNNRLT